MERHVLNNFSLSPIFHYTHVFRALIGGLLLGLFLPECIFNDFKEGASSKHMNLCKISQYTVCPPAVARQEDVRGGVTCADSNVG